MRGLVISSKLESSSIQLRVHDPDREGPFAPPFVGFRAAAASYRFLLLFAAEIRQPARLFLGPVCFSIDIVFRPSASTVHDIFISRGSCRPGYETAVRVSSLEEERASSDEILPRVQSTTATRLPRQEDV